jgi:D-alanyl-D-alanine carboxypeptidase
MKTLLALLLLSGCAGDVVTPSAECPSSSFSQHPRHARYDALLSEYCTTARAPGCIVMVDRPGEPLWAGSRGLADLSTGAPMCIDTSLRVGSVSKTYVAAMIMKLIDEGKLERQTTLAAALPSVVGRIPSTELITLEHLLGHRSGVLNPESQDLFAQTDYFDRPDQLIPLTLEQRFERYVYDRPLLFPPGSARRYSNPGYDLLGLVAARAQDASLQQTLERLILSPLQLNNTSFLNRDGAGIPRGYVDTAEGRLIDVTTSDKANVNELSPSGGLVATAGDVRAFWRALFSGAVVSQASLDFMKADTGNGLFLEKADGVTFAYGHQGALIGESTWALYFPAEDAVVVLSLNTSGTSSDVPFARRLLE